MLWNANSNFIIELKFKLSYNKLSSDKNNVWSTTKQLNPNLKITSKITSNTITNNIDFFLIFYLNVSYVMRNL